ncbi:hypothetical protein [Azospirillum doebereinerae]
MLWNKISADGWRILGISFSLYLKMSRVVFYDNLNVGIVDNGRFVASS